MKEENDITYEYDNNSNLTETEEQDNSIIRTYDELDRVIEKTENGLTSIYTYDIEGYQEKTIDPVGNIIIKEYDKVGRLIQVNGEVEYLYNIDGTLKKLTYQNGATEEYYYNPDKTLQRLVNTNGNVVEEYKYEYDGYKNIIKEISPKGTITNTYDALNRLKTVTKNNVTTTYSYDAGGNRSREVTGSVIKDYVYSSSNVLNQITERNSGTVTKVTTYENDDNGNQLQEIVNSVVTTTNTYNDKNELIETVSNNQTTSYGYNAEGKRIEKTKGNDTTKFVYESDKVILELDEDDEVFASNIYGLNLITRTVNNVKGYYQYNGHADVVSIIDSNNTVLNGYEYDVWGNIVNETETMDNPFRYAGYYYDSETSNYYLMARYYNPVIARFITEDTYRGQYNDPLSLNRYVYVHNNPLIYYDPTGYFLEEIFAGALVAKQFVEIRLTAIVETGTEMVIDTAVGLADLSWTAGQFFAAGTKMIGNVALYELGQIDEETLYKNHDKYEKIYNESKDKISGTPEKIFDGIIDNGKKAIDIQRIIKYWDPRTTDEKFIKEQTKATISTGITAYSTYQLAKGAYNWIDNKLHPQPTAPKYPGNDPTVPPGKDYVWKGNGDPASGKGNWVNPKTGETWNSDLNHGQPIGPHWDYTPNKGHPGYRVFPDGRIEPK